jgi:hypothetical protein
MSKKNKPTTNTTKGETRSYHVDIPIAGRATFIVEATDEESAKAAAWKAIDEGVEPEIEWEYHEQIASGNVLHASHNEVEVGLA